MLDVQSDLIETTGSRVVVPLITPERAGGVIQRLMPFVPVGGESMVMDTSQIMGIPMRMLGEPVADISKERGAITADAIAKRQDSPSCGRGATG